MIVYENTLSIHLWSRRLQVLVLESVSIVHDGSMWEPERSLYYLYV